MLSPLLIGRRKHTFPRRHQFYTWLSFVCKQTQLLMEKSKPTIGGERHGGRRKRPRNKKQRPRSRHRQLGKLLPTAIYKGDYRKTHFIVQSALCFKLQRKIMKWARCLKVKTLRRAGGGCHNSLTCCKIFLRTPRSSLEMCDNTGGVCLKGNAD